MAETTQPRNWPSPRGPWPEVTDLSRLFDHGAWWCANRAGHPDPENGYPDAEGHTPWDECRSLAGSFAGVRAGLTGPRLEVEVYVAAPFRFGRLAAEVTGVPVSPRVVFECYSDGDTESSELRFSLPLGEALLLVRRLEHLVDEVSYPRRSPDLGSTR